MWPSIGGPRKAGHDTGDTMADNEVGAPEGIFVRRDAWRLQEADPWEPVTLAYARAVAEMQTRDSEDPTSWAYQAAIHGTYSPAPPGAKWNECQHGNWYFFPWHRMYLYYFERIVRSVVVSQGGPEDWALPYWNYDEGPPSNTLPPAFRLPDLPDGAPNPLFLGGQLRAPGINEGAALPPHATSSEAGMRFQNFTGSPQPGFGGVVAPRLQFSGAFGGLEGGPHNLVHGLVGGPISPERCSAGLMSDPDCAARDPIFWLHHANIDRLWSAWTALGEGRADPETPDWRDETFTFCDEAGTTVSLTCADVVDNEAQLGYRYDSQVSAVARAVSTHMSSAPPPDRPAELVGATDQPIVLAGSSASADVTIEAPAATSRAVTARDAGRPTRYYLQVEDIEGERNPGIGYDVYLSPGAGNKEAGDRFVGTVSFFGIEHMQDVDRDHDGPVGLRHVFDITEMVAELRRQGQWDEEHFTVNFQPLRLEAPPGMDRSALARPGAEETPTVRVGRVSLFVE